jgi:hypothetical protein
MPSHLSSKAMKERREQELGEYNEILNKKGEPRRILLDLVSKNEAKTPIQESQRNRLESIGLQIDEPTMRYTNMYKEFKNEQRQKEQQLLSERRLNLQEEAFNYRVTKDSSKPDSVPEKTKADRQVSAALKTTKYNVDTDSDREAYFFNEFKTGVKTEKPKRGKQEKPAKEKAPQRQANPHSSSSDVPLSMLERMANVPLDQFNVWSN